jgi:hypothetical protein
LIHIGRHAGYRFKGCVPPHRTYVLETGTPSPFPSGMEL